MECKDEMNFETRFNSRNREEESGGGSVVMVQKFITNIFHIN